MSQLEVLSKTELDEIEEIKIKMVSSPLYFNKYLDILFSPVKLDTVDNLYRCSAWLLYFGVKLDDIVSIKISDVDLYKRRIVYDNQVYKILDEALDVFESCVNAKSFLYKHHGQGIWRDRPNSGFLIHGETEELKVRTIKNMLQKFMRDAQESGLTNKRMSIGSITLSGEYYSIKKYTMDTGLSPEKELKELSRAHTLKFNKSAREGTALFRRYMNVHIDKNCNKYDLWLKAGSF